MEIRLSQVTKRFGGAAAVDAIDVSVPKGALMTLLGPSGCGKTTTLRMVAGLEKPDGGEIHIGDRCVFGPTGVLPPEKRRIGMVFQSYAIWPHMTVFRNVAYPLTIRRVARAERRERTMRALETVRLDALADRYPSQLSGGQQQRVALARAIVIEPDILLLDEPLSNLDAMLRDHMRLEIRKLQQRLELTTLYVTHDQQEALSISDLVTVMRDGHVVQTGSPEQIYEQPNCRFVADFVGWTNFLPVDAVGRDSASALGVSFKCRVPADLNGAENLLLAVRPEDVRRSDDMPADAAGANRLCGRIRTLAYAGRQFVCEMECAQNQKLMAHLPAGSDLYPGARVELYIDPERLLVLPG